MLRKARDLDDFALHARDGRIGHVRDFFFDDRRWTIRYLVVETGTWLDHREVLIAPAAVHAPDWSERVLPVDLTREQVEQSPTVDPDEPVSREQELLLAQYYNWPMYWAGAGFADTMFLPTAFVPPSVGMSPRRAGATSSLDAQHHIRSVADIRGHRIEANDGPIGHVDDFLIDDDDWTIGYLVVDTRNWWPGKRVLLAPDWIFEVGWEDAKVFVDLSRQTIKRSPTYDSGVPVTREYADLLHEHYGQPRRSAEP